MNCFKAGFDFETSISLINAMEANGKGHNGKRLEESFAL